MRARLSLLAAPMRRAALRLRRPLGIRAQLTLLYTAIFAVLFLVVAGAYYLYLDRTLQATFDATLTTRTAQIASGISLENGSLNIQDVTGELPRNASGSASGSTSGGVDGSPNADGVSGTTGTTGTGQSGPQSDVMFGTLVRILDPQGKIVYVSPGFQALAVPHVSVSDPLGGAEWLGTVTAPSGTVVRVESVPLRDNGHIYGVLQVGASATSLTETLRTAAIALFGVAPLLLLLGAGGSYWLARRALRPVMRLTRSAQEIEARDLHHRVPVPQARDEIQTLALTLNGMIARLECAFDQQRRFVADASHELRTPVAAIQSLTDVALAQPGSAEDTAETLRAVNSEAQRLGALISELLALARADEGKIHLERAPVRLDLLATDVAGVMEPLATERAVTLTLHLTPATVLGDDARLIQMLLNLVDNAVRYTPAGGQVDIAVETQGQQTYAIVRDTGHGIAPQHLPHIFERFYRADVARTRSESGGEGGSGLGLAIVEWVVGAHGGSIAVESQPEQGTTVTVSLPRAPEAATLAPTASRSDLPASLRPSLSSGVRTAPDRH
jgi:heavy metal sensor kinase